MTEAAIPAEAVQLAEQTWKIASLPATLSIVTTQQYEDAGEKLKALSAKEKEIEKLRTQLKAPILAAGRAIDAFFNTPLDRITKARDAYKLAIKGYQRVEEQKRLALEAKAQEEARKERERLEARAAAAAAKGKTEKAEVLQTAAASIVSPVIPKTTPKLQGVSNRKTWHYEVEDVALLPREYMQPDDKKLGAYIRAMKSEAQIPGVRIYSEDDIAG